MKKRLFIMDIDGTLSLGSTPYPGTLDLLDEIHRQGGYCCYFTNNSSRSIAEYVEKFARMGIATTPDEFLTAGSFAIHCMKQMFGDKKIYVQGTKGYLAECVRGGLTITDHDEEGIDAVLCSYDLETDYQKISETCKVLETRKVPWYATNEDLCCPCEFGMVPDCGAICGMIAAAVGRSPVYLGKPSAAMAQHALERFGCSAKEALVVGDRLYTDIAAGENAGIDTCLVLTGEETHDIGRGTYCLESVKDLYELVKEQRWENVPRARGMENDKI